MKINKFKLFNNYIIYVFLSWHALYVLHKFSEYI